MIKYNIKKILFSVFVFAFVLFGYSYAFATVTTNETNPATTGTSVTFFCSDGDRVVFFDSTGEHISHQSCSPLTGTGVVKEAGVYTIVECKSSLSNSNCDASGTRNLSAFNAIEVSSGSNVSQTSFEWRASTGGGTGGAVSGIHFFEPSALTGDASVTNQLGASVGTTTGSLLPVVAVVGGIILAMIGIKWVVDTLKNTADNKKTK